MVVFGLLEPPVGGTRVVTPGSNLDAMSFFRDGFILLISALMLNLSLVLEVSMSFALFV